VLLMNEFRYATGTSSGTSGLGDGMPEADQQPSAGELLRAAREAAGLHIAALAVSLKVPVKKLEALEQDRTDLLPDATFARALAASICRTLKVDPGPVLARLPQGGAAHLKRQTQRTPTPFRSPGERSGFPFRSMVTRPTMLAGVALLVGTLALVFWPALKDAAVLLAGRGDKLAAPPEPPLILELTGPSTPDSGAQQAGTGTGSVEGKISAQTLPSIFAPTAMQASSLASPALRSETAKTVSSAENQPVPATGTVAATGGIVTFSARGQSWVEVTDAKGTVVLRRTLAAGEVVGATGVLPMAAVVGKADSTQVEVRGKPLNLQPLSRDNVARFEVK
jgi:cytoskeleton protein RodZ